MKKILPYFVIGAIALITFTNCGTAKKTTQSQPSTNTGKNLVPWTAKLQDSLKFTKDQAKGITFYLGSPVKLSGGFFSMTSFVEDGKIVMVDTTERRSRMIDSLTEGHMIGIPQTDPGKDWPIKAQIVRFTKGEMDFDLGFKLDDNGNTVLNKDATVTFQGKTYSITSHFVDQFGNNRPTVGKLFAGIERRHVVIEDHQ